MKLLFIVGSLRKNSFNHQLARQAAQDLKNKADVSFLEWNTVPIFDQDLEAETPDIIKKIRDEVKEADSLWFFTPEYNGMVPGGLKNLLDWLSRPVDPAYRKSGTAIRGKTVTISGVSGKSAAKGSRDQLEKLLTFMGCKVLSNQGYAVPIQQMIADSWTISESDLKELQNQADMVTESFSK